ncbi:MAG: hypothetical protein ACJA2E_000600 [Arenicella sp.]|jgi:hypothetical protein
MHATNDQLLEIIDGQQSPLREHLAECKQCQIELAELQSFQSEIGLQMFDAADKVPSHDVWNRIQSSLDQESELLELQGINQRTSNVVSLAAVPQPSLSRPIYALAASIAFVGIVSIFMFSQQQNSQTQILQASLNELMLNSRGLEHVLHRVADQNQGLSVASQKAADRLYWRLTYVDQLINQASPENTERMEVLWSNRIEALNALNQIYYQQESTLNTSEI